MIGKDIVATADFLSNEHNLSKDVVFDAIETALSISAKKDYDPSGRIELKCEIDRKTGSYSFYRKWTVVDDNEKNFDSEKHYYDDQAEELFGRPVEIGEVFTKFLSKDKPLSRISAQVFKNTIKEQIRMAIKINAQEKFTHQVGDLFKVSVSRFMKSDILVSIDDTVEGVIKKQGLQKKDKLKIGQVLYVVLSEVVENYKGQQLIFDRMSDDFVKAVIKNEIPDFEDEDIVIKSFARDKGKKTIVSVSSNIPNLDAVATCIGVKGNRVKNIRDIIGGEAVEFVLWNQETDAFLSSVFSRKAENILADEEDMSADIGLNDKAYEQIKNIKIEEQILSKLTGFDIHLYRNEEFLKKQESVFNYYVTLFKEKLMVDEGIAEVLFSEGFEDFTTIAYVSDEEYDEFFDEETTVELKARAVSIIKESEKATVLGELMTISDSIISRLNENEVFTIEDLAYLSSDELKDILPELRTKEIGKIVKEAKDKFFA